MAYLLVGVAVGADARLERDERLLILGALDVPELTYQAVADAAAAEERDEVAAVANADAGAGADPAARPAAEALGGTAAHHPGVERRHRSRREVGQGDGRRRTLGGDARRVLRHRLRVLGLGAGLELLGLVAGGAAALAGGEGVGVLLDGVGDGRDHPDRGDEDQDQVDDQRDGQAFAAQLLPERPLRARRLHLLGGRFGREGFRRSDRRVLFGGGAGGLVRHTLGAEILP